MMRLGQTVKRVQLLKIKAQVSSIWAKGCILIIVCVCVGVCASVCVSVCVCVNCLT